MKILGGDRKTNPSAKLFLISPSQKSGKKHGFVWVSTNGTDVNHFNMSFYDSSGVFKPIFDDFDFFGFLCTRAAPVDAAK